MLHAEKFTGARSRPTGFSGDIVALAQDFSIETTPKQATKVENFAGCLPQGTRVFIAVIPGEALENIVSLAERLISEGMRPVPHVPARSIESFETFERYVTALRSVGVTEALVLAGGLQHPVGALTDSMQLLASGLFERLGFEGLFVAGHPEGNPDIPDLELARALAFKNDYAARTGLPLTITTQFSFEADKVLAWSKLLENADNQLPVRLGVAGPASVTALLKYAKMCGVGASMSMLSKAGGKLFQLVGQAAPDGFICQIAQAGNATAISHLHFYPFGGFVKNAGWASAVARGEFILHPKDSGFTVSD